MGVEVTCGITGRYVSLVKESADAGMDTFDVCTFGVLATCDCSALELTWENTEEYFDSVQVRKGERNVFDLHAPEYKTTDANLEGACADMEWDCEFWYGIRQPSDRSKQLPWVTTINGGRLVVLAPDDIEADEYELIIETFDLHEPSLILNTHTMIIEVVEEFEDVEPVALAPIILE